jgi:ABC-type lipoprotein release transport system permease subunit
MTPAELRQASAELDFLRRRRELFFWTMTMTLALVVLVVMTVAFVVSMVHGAPIDIEQLAVGAGITGANGAGAQIPGLLRRFA